MWHFRHKHNADDDFERYKARLVVNGRNQQIDINCEETFSPIVKPATIRTMLSISLSRSWSILQMDVKNAFMNGGQDETVYMHQPPDFVTVSPGICVSIAQGFLWFKTGFPCVVLSLCIFCF